MELRTLKQYQNLAEKGHVIYIDRDFSRKGLKSFRKQSCKIISENEGIKTIAIVINSYGGNTDSAYQMINEIEALRSKYDVWVIGGAIAASAAAITLLSIPKNRRVAFPRASIYNHKPHSSTTERVSVNFPELHYTNREDMAAAKQIREIEKEVIAQIARETNLTTKEAKRLVKKKPKFLSAKEGLELGFYSRILT